MNLQHTRPPFSLLAYGNNQACRLTGIAEHHAELISIGMSEARVRLQVTAEDRFRFGERCLLHLPCAPGGQPLGTLACRMAWMNGREAGLTFNRDLEVSLLALQLVIAQGLRAREEAA